MIRYEAVVSLPFALRLSKGEGASTRSARTEGRLHLAASKMQRTRGFTLIELLIALAVFSVLALLAYGGLNTLLNTRAMTDQQADALRELQLAYRSVERDLDQWVPREIRDEFAAVKPALGAGGELGAVLELTRGGWRNPAEQPRSTLQRVAYGLQDGKLVRMTWLNLDRAPDARPAKQELLADVRELRLRFLDAANVWQDRWPPAGTATASNAPVAPRLPVVPSVPGAPAAPVAPVVVPAAPSPPRAIEVVLVSERWGELRWLFRLPG